MALLPWNRTIMGHALSLLVLPIAWFLFAQAPAGTPRAGEVAGEVIHAGSPPVAARLRVARDVDVCGPHQPEEDLVVTDGRLANAVVMLRPHEPRAPVDRRSQAIPVLDQKGCRFSPRVLVAPPGARLRVLNPDPLVHSVEIIGAGARLDLAMEPGKTEATVGLAGRFDRPEVLAVRCGVHPWMTAYLVLTDAPHAAVTDAGGRFKLESVQAGRHTLSVWHERLGLTTRNITVNTGETANIAIRVGEGRAQ